VQRQDSIDRARDCLIESLATLGALSEVEPMVDQMIVDQVAEFGDDHPRVADYLSIRASIEVAKGKIADARKDADRALAIRKKVLAPRHIKIAEALSISAKFAMAEGKYADAKQQFEEALAIAQDAKPEQVLLLGQLHTILAAIAQQLDHDQAAAMRHYEEAIPLVKKRAGADSLELGILLSNYGQVKAAEDVDAGLAILGEARAILDRLNDKRATLVALAMAEVEVDHKRFTAAKSHAEDMLAHASPDEDPANIALGKWALAEALVGMKTDIGKARQVAGEARTTLAGLGAAYADTVKKIDAFLKK
jgi:serine/threonine-protein kinase